MQIETRSIDDIKPYEKNPRYNAPAVAAVAKSIEQFGFRQPIVIDEGGVIIAGHTRYKAALRLEIKEVPVHVAQGLTPEQVRAYRIADNKTADLASWDTGLLPDELLAIQNDGFDLPSLGFSDAELAALLGNDAGGGAGDPDSAPEPPEDATTCRGDIWILGDHRLMCGDSGNPADLDRLLDGATIDLVNMDPPYNVKVEPRSNNAIAASNKGKQQTHHQKLDLVRHPGKAKGTTEKMRPKDRQLENDFVTDEAFQEMLRAWFGNASRVLRPGGSFYIWGGYTNLTNYPPVIEASDLYYSQAIVWDKQHPVLTRKDFMGAFEICFYGWKKGGAHHFYGPNNVSDLWPIKKLTHTKMVHLTEKPVELATRAIGYSSLPGQAVLDLFGGSGSTIIGCEQTGRRGFSMEIDPWYCDVIVQRWEHFTGKKAERIPAANHEETPAEGAGVDEQAAIT